MRLRLSVRRHKLPPVDLLWAVPEDKAHAGFTIAQLLEEVNAVLPLENAHWGLEDYAAEIDGFEALHFHKIADVFKDEDSVCIRHLTQPEVRARHVSGRDQINANGQHLIDGIPFGKPYFPHRRLQRPAINIPPMRPPIADQDIAGLLENGQQTQDASTGNHEDAHYASEAPARKRRRITSARSDRSDKSVHFEDKGNEMALALLSSDSESWNYEPDSDAESDSGSSSSSDTDSSSGISSDSSSDATSSSVSEQADAHVEDADSTNDSSVDSSSTSTDSSDSDLSSESTESSSEDSSDLDSMPEEISSKPKRVMTDVLGTRNSSKKALRDRNHPEQSGDSLGSWYVPDKEDTQVLSPHYPQQADPQRPPVPPGSGKASTKQRNKRRRLARSARKMQGRQEFDEADQETTDVATEDLEDQGTATQPNGNSTSATENGCQGEIDISMQEQEVAVEATEGGLATSAQEGGIDAHQGEAIEKCQSPGQENASGRPSRRSRVIDKNAFRRIAFGSLGVRNPKNKAEEDALREKLSSNVSLRGRKKPLPRSQVDETDEEPADLEGPDAWKDRIDLKAFEVVDEHVQELSTPPFPFQQRWDPQQQYAKNRKKRRRKQYDEEEYYEEYNEQYNEEGYYGEEYYEGEGGDGYQEQHVSLNYDEEDNYEKPRAPEDKVGDGAQSQLLQEIQEATDLPPLPSDVKTLPTLSREDARPGSVIVYNVMECSPATSWQPVISGYRTAKVLERDDDALHLELAARDRPPTKEHKTTKDGKRLYEKFEMDGTEEGDEDPGKPWVDFTEFNEAFLLQPASEDTTAGMADDAHAVDVDQTDMAAES